MDLVETLIYYDEPLMFIGKMYNELYFCMKLDDHKYVYVKVSQNRIDDIKNNKIDLYDAFFKSEDGMATIAKTDNGKIEYTDIKSSSLLPEELPEPNVFLKD